MLRVAWQHDQLTHSANAGLAMNYSTDVIQEVTELKNVRVVFFDVQGTEGSTLTAKRGTYRWQDGSMEANDKVLVVSPGGALDELERVRDFL